MDLLPLPIFPEGSLRESVVTTVWIGVWVISFFNLRFGWSYSGLVIPGYLVPLMLTNPLSGCITIVEGMLAYGLVWLFSEHLSKFGWWCNFFGRDRFFALFLSSVLVRVTMDGWCLPWTAGWLQGHFGLTLDYQGAFHSFGMIILALIANQFWKTGLWRGLAPFGLTLGISFIIIRFGLMTLTNFNVGHIAYMYSDTAASLLASPKSYMILIVTGFVASRMNLRYGWEYNGILIPALLALQWYEPLKILSSFAEAAVVYLVSDRLLQLSVFRGITMEGARKLLLFFNVAYAYRLLLGFLLPLLSPDLVVNDFYGFAYLLSSLIALKMHSKHIVLRLTRATLQTSFVAALAANLLGLWVASLLGSIGLKAHLSSEPLGRLQESADSFDSLAAQQKLRLFESQDAGTLAMPTPEELNQFHHAISLLLKYAINGDTERLTLSRRLFKTLGYELLLADNRWLCLKETHAGRGWGFYVVDTKHPSGLLVEVPSPVEEWGVMEAGIQVFRSFNGSALAIAGAKRNASRNGSADVLANPYTPFHVFHRVFSRANVLQVRAAAQASDLYASLASRDASTDQTTTTRKENREPWPSACRSSCLWVKTELPSSLPLRTLHEKIPQLNVCWHPAPSRNLQQRHTRRGFAELWLSPGDCIRLKAEFGLAGLSGKRLLLLEGAPILEWLLQQKGAMAKSGSNAYRPPSEAEVRFFDQEILTPLVALANHGQAGPGLPALGTTLLQAVDHSARLLGYRANLHYDPGLQRQFLVLAESPESRSRHYWGTVVFRLGPRRPYAVQVPRPLFDMNTLEYGVHLFERLNAEYLLLAGSHNESNQDTVSDVLDFRNTANLFSLVNQVCMREARGEPKMTIQCRGYANLQETTDEPDVLLALQDGLRTQSMLTPLARTLLQSIVQDGFQTKLVDGSPITAGYEISCVPQAQYLNASSGKEFAILWLSSAMREAFRSADEEYPLQAQLKALGIPIARGELQSALGNHSFAAPKTRLPPGLKECLNYYVRTLNIVALEQALRRFSQFSFSALLDRNSQQLFLLIRENPSSFPAVLNLRPKSEESGIPSLGEEKNRVRQFLCSRAAWLE